VLKIIETNQFKQLCHLCLNISIGTDADIKKHLAVQVKLLKVQIFIFFKNVTNLQTVQTSCFCIVSLFIVKIHVKGLFQVITCHNFLLLKYIYIYIYIKTFIITNKN
jgi:hypothetical protein